MDSKKIGRYIKMKLTLAITVWNRYEMLLESFANVIDDPRIDEILIMDDASAPEYWNKIKELPKFNPKIKVVRQLVNYGMSRNKRDAVFHSKNDWIILFDSDNIIGKDYLDALEVEEKRDGRLISTFIYCPSFAKPNFDYRKFEPVSIWWRTIREILSQNDPMFNCFLNTCNYVVNREQYLRVWRSNSQMKGSDTIWHNYNHLITDGGLFRVVPGMHYEHRVHRESGFLQDVDYNMKKGEEIKKLIMEL